MEVIMYMGTLGYFGHNNHTKIGQELYLPSANFKVVVIHMHGGHKSAHRDFGPGNSCD